jgi:hypothetical protein
VLSLFFIISYLYRYRRRAHFASILCRQFQQIDLDQLITPFRIRGLSYPLLTVLTAVPRCEVFEVEAIRNTRLHLLSTDHVGDPKSNPDSAAA